MFVSPSTNNNELNFQKAVISNKQTGEIGNYQISHPTDLPTSKITTSSQACQEELRKNYEESVDKELQENSFTSLFSTDASQKIDLHFESTFPSTQTSEKVSPEEPIDAGEVLKGEDVEEEDDLFGDSVDEAAQQVEEQVIESKEVVQEEKQVAQVEEQGAQVEEQDAHEEEEIAQVEKQVAQVETQTVDLQANQTQEKLKTKVKPGKTTGKHAQTGQTVYKANTSVFLSFLRDSSAYEKVSDQLHGLDPQEAERKLTKAFSKESAATEERSIAIMKQVVGKMIQKRAQGTGQTLTQQQIDVILDKFEAAFRQYYLLEMARMPQETKPKEEKSLKPLFLNGVYDTRQLDRMKVATVEQVVDGEVVDEIKHKVIQLVLNETAKIAKKLEEDRAERKEQDYWDIKRDVRRAEDLKQELKKEALKTEIISRSSLVQAIKHTRVFLRLIAK